MGPFEDASAPCHVIVVTWHVVQMHQRARLMPPRAPDAAPQGDVDHQQEQHGHDAPARPSMGMRQVAGQRHALKGHGHAHHQTQHGGHAAQAVHALPATMVDDPGPVLTGHDLPVACRQHGHRHQHGTGRAHQHAVPEIHRVDVVERPVMQGRVQPVQPGGELRQQPGGQMKEVQHGRMILNPRDPLNKSREPARHGTGCRTRRHLLSIAALLTANGNAIMRPLRGCDGRGDLFRGSPGIGMRKIGKNRPGAARGVASMPLPMLSGRCRIRHAWRLCSGDAIE